MTFPGILATIKKNKEINRAKAYSAPHVSNILISCTVGLVLAKND